jgi:malate permease and related proteins
MHLVNVILPIFIVISIGFILRKAGFFDDPFVRILNRLVYQVLLPVLVFWEIARSSFHSSFNPRLVVVTYTAMGVLWLAIQAGGTILRLEPALVGSFNQGAFRGNLAYIGLAVAANVYGASGLSKAGVLTGFMIPFMNLFSILGLPGSGGSQWNRRAWGLPLEALFFHPLLLASFGGLLFSYFSWPIPAMIAGTLRLLSGLSLPLALISLGGSLSFRGIGNYRLSTALAVFLKLLFLPLLGLLLLQASGISGLDFRVTVLLLACPTAVVTYIMAVELGGDPALAASIVMISTLLSMASLPFWIWLVGF